MFSLLELDLLAERAAQNQRIRASQTGCAPHSKWLEVTAVRPDRFQTGLPEFLGDVVGRKIDSLGLDAAALTLIRSQEGDVFPHALQDGFISRRNLAVS